MRPGRIPAWQADFPFLLYPHMPDDKTISAPDNIPRDTECLNCGTRFDGRYCPECGQKYNTARLTWYKLLDNLVYGLTNLDRGWVKTIAGLFTRPGKIMREYIEGHRVVYTNPFPMLVVLCGIFGLVSVLIGHSPTEVAEVILDDYDAQEASMEMIKWLYEHMLVIMLAMLPMTAFFTRLFFRRAGARRYNYTEMLFVAAFISCQYMIFSIVMLPVEHFLVPLLSDVVLTIISLAILFLTAWCYRGFFGVGWFQATWKSILILILSYISIIIALTFIVVAAMIWKPEIFMFVNT